MLLCLWVLLSVGQVVAQGTNAEVDEWKDWDDYDEDDQEMFLNTESDDLPSKASDWDEKDDLDEGLLPVPPTDIPNVIPPTSDPPSPPSSPTPPSDTPTSPPSTPTSPTNTPTPPPISPTPPPITPTSPPSTPTPPPQTEEIPTEASAQPQSPVPETEAIAATSSQEESALLVVVVMTAGTFLAVFAIYTLFARKGGKKPSQVANGREERSRLLKVPRHSL